MAYLAGPGRANEHTEPHLVAGDPALLAWYDDGELGRDSALAIARHLDRPHEVYGVEVKGGHVWHCSLSLRAEEGQLTDDTWKAIAEDFITAMDFDDHEGTKAPCRWVAVRHGLSKNGNDHIHIAVNLVREDGTKASIHKDFYRAQVATRALEVKYGLEQLESSKDARATRGFDPAEREAQARARARAKHERARTGAAPGPSAPAPFLAWEQLDPTERQRRIVAEMRADQPRVVLAVKVRGCAAASTDEAEFVRRMRGAGLLVRPRFADGRTDVVTGYSVAERPVAGERPIWYGGGHLGRDLTLPRLRDGWPDSPQGATAAAAEWSAAKRGRRVVTRGRETQEPSPEMWARHNAELVELTERIRGVPLDDRDTWATVAKQTAGAFAAWSNATEDTPGDLAAAAEALSRSGQTYRRTIRPERAGAATLSGTAMLLASAARGGRGPVGEAAMMKSLLRITQAIHDASVAAGQARQAQLLSEDIRGRLTRIRDELQAHAASAVAAASTSPARTPLDPDAQAVLRRLHADRPRPPASPLPAPLTPAVKRPAATTTGRDRDLER